MTGGRESRRFGAGTQKAVSRPSTGSPPFGQAQGGRQAWDQAGWQRRRARREKQSFEIRNSGFEIRNSSHPQWHIANLSVHRSLFTVHHSQIAPILLSECLWGTKDAKRGGI